MQVAAVDAHRQSVEGLGELVPGVGQRAGYLHVVISSIGGVAASAASTTTAVPAAFHRALAVVIPVCADISDGTRVVVYVELLLAEGEPAVHHGVQPQLSLQQLLGNDKSGHGHVEGEMDGDDFVAPQDAAHHDGFGLNVDQFVAMALADEVEVVLVAGRAAGYRDVYRETGFLHDVPDGVLSILHLELHGAAGAEAAFALKRQADALVGAMVHADQTGHLASADLADGVQLSNLLKDGVESGFFF